MGNFEDVIDKCKEQMQQQNIEIDEALLTSIAKSLGPSIYDADGLTVATGDEGEMATVKRFATEKLGATEGADLDASLARCTEAIGKSNTHKLRPVYYYLLVKDLGRESAFA